ncbi:hypothetical protein EG874_16670, partial [Enterococcus faecalis]
DPADAGGAGRLRQRRDPAGQRHARARPAGAAAPAAAAAGPRAALLRVRGAGGLDRLGLAAGRHARHAARGARVHLRRPPDRPPRREGRGGGGVTARRRGGPCFPRPTPPPCNKKSAKENKETSRARLAFIFRVGENGGVGGWRADGGRWMGEAPSGKQPVGQRAQV